jgi:hypothetical protein
MPLMKPTDIIFRIGANVHWTAVSSAFFDRNCIVRFIKKPNDSSNPSTWNVTVAPFVNLPHNPPYRSVLNPSLAQSFSADDSDGFIYMWIDGDLCYPWDTNENNQRWGKSFGENTIFWGSRIPDVNFNPN